MKKKIIVNIFILTMIVLLGITVYAGNNPSIVATNIIKALVFNNSIIEGEENIVEYNGKIYISEDIISKNLGCNVNFDKESNTVFIESRKISTIYPSIREINDYLCDDDWNEFKGGCSWYCAGQVDKVEGSSALKGQNNISYSPDNAHDFNLDTVWCEGTEGYGEGQYLEYTLPGNQVGLAITQIEVLNGYIKSDTLWKENGRVKSLKMYKNGEPTAILMLEDTKKMQVFDIGYIPLGQETKLKFEILDVYKGSKYEDTVITELEFNGIGDH